jgi:hypothetical protein
MTSWSLIKESEEIAVYAADELINTKKKKNSVRADVIWIPWKRGTSEAGKSIVPWMGFAGCKLRTPPKSCQKPEETASLNDSLSPGSLMTEDDASRTLVSFDFSGATSGDEIPMHQYFRGQLVCAEASGQRTALMHQPASDVCKKLIMAHRRDEGTETSARLASR